MVHKTSILPGLSAFIDQAVLSQYAPTSFKRIAAAGAIAIYLKQNSNIVDNILNNPVVTALHVTTEDGMINLETLRTIYKEEIHKAGFMRINFPILGNVDFTETDVDTLYQLIMSINNTPLPS
jgi:hypothetical protein